MKTKTLRGEISPEDLILKDGENDWRVAKEWREFPQELFPAFQVNYFKKFSAEEKGWILLKFENDIPRQKGPFSAKELQDMQKSGQIHGEDYVWKSGLTGWVRVCDRQEI